MSLLFFLHVNMGVSENSVPLNPMVLLIIIKWLFHWEYTQHFRQTHMGFEQFGFQRYQVTVSCQAPWRGRRVSWCGDAAMRLHVPWTPPLEPAEEVGEIRALFFSKTKQGFFKILPQKKKHLKHLEVLHFHRTTAEQTRCTAVVYQFFNGRGTEERPQFPGSKHQASAVALDRVHHQRPPPKSLTSSRPAAARVYGVWRCHCNLWCRPHDCLTANPKR